MIQIEIHRKNIYCSYPQRNSITVSILDLAFILAFLCFYKMTLIEEQCFRNKLNPAIGKEEFGDELVQNVFEELI